MTCPRCGASMAALADCLRPDALPEDKAMAAHILSGCAECQRTWAAWNARLARRPLSEVAA